MPALKRLSIEVFWVDVGLEVQRAASGEPERSEILRAAGDDIDDRVAERIHELLAG